MKKYKKIIKCLAFVMSIVMILVSTPIQAISLNIIDELNNLEADSLQGITGIEKADLEQGVYIVEEDASKRGRFEKHYLCSDGTYVSVMYSESVHYLDDSDKWQDVDQALVYDSSKGIYISEKSDFNVSFAEKASATNIANVEKNGYSLS